MAVILLITKQHNLMFLQYVNDTLLSSCCNYHAYGVSVTSLQLKTVAKEALRVFGAPLLLVARKHLSRQLHTEKQALQSGINLHSVEK